MINANEKRIKIAVKKFMKNPYWKEYLESAPSEACRRYVELEFYYSDCLGEVDNYEEFKSLKNKLEQKFDYADWKHLYNHCANNPKKAYYKKKLGESAKQKTD